MKITKTLLATALLLAIGLTSNAANLLPENPKFTFWTPPYSTYQPSYDETGALHVDLTPAAGKNIAVLKFEVKALEAGKQYAFTASAKSESRTAVILTLPEAKGDGSTDAKGNLKPKTDWINLNPNWKRIEGRFTYDPEIGEKEVGFVVIKRQLEGGGGFTLKDLQLIQLD